MPRQDAPAQAKAARAAARDAEDWSGRLQQALGDDTALMALASSAPGLDIRLAAVEAMAGEDALRQAERAFRTRDRRVHSLAKHRLGAAVARRTAHATAERLLQRGQTLLADPHLPLNHLARLDREWEAVSAALPDPAQHAAFAALRAQLDDSLRARAEAEQRLQGWTVEVQRALPDWQAALASAGHQPPDEAQAALAAVRLGAQALLATQPPHAAAAALGSALTQLLGAADAVQARVDAAPPAPPPAAVEPTLDDASQPTVAQTPTPGRDPSAGQCQQLEALLQEADAALDEGQLLALQQRLQAAEALVGSARGRPWPPALVGRLQALRAEHARLKAWQAWGGQRAREDLIMEAEALARRVRPPAAEQGGTQAPPGPESADEAPQDTASAPGEATLGAAPAMPPAVPGDESLQPAPAQTATAAHPDEAPTPAPVPVHQPDPAVPGRPSVNRRPLPGPKLNVRAHAEAIRALRMRWKALDKPGERPPGDLWQRFDDALTSAHGPVAAHNAAQQAAREQNLLARQALLATLESLVPPASDAEPAAAWGDLARQLDAFQRAWHPLGPVEHTVPADAREPLQQRLEAALERVDAPLRRARDRAATEREQLIERALALAAVDGRGLPEGEPQRALRRLQAEWQEQARSLPLQRSVETALWARFRSATDTVFAQRDAAAAARGAAQADEVAEREALIERLDALSAQTPTPEIERTLGEVDRAWREAPVRLPRAAGQELEARYRDARAVAAGRASAAARARWHAGIDALMARLQAAHGAAPAGGTGGVAASPDAQRIDEALLRLEAALELPAAPALQAARRQLKLRALKEAMEGSAPASEGPASAAAWLATLQAAPALDALQHDRLRALLRALRDAAPGTLGLTFPDT